MTDDTQQGMQQFAVVGIVGAGIVFRHHLCIGMPVHQFQPMPSERTCLQ